MQEENSSSQPCPEVLLGVVEFAAYKKTESGPINKEYPLQKRISYMYLMHDSMDST